MGLRYIPDDRNPSRYSKGIGVKICALDDLYIMKFYFRSTDLSIEMFGCRDKHCRS